MTQNDWYVSWFDTHYYHLLYRDRDFNEAKKFIHRLADELHFEKGVKALDLACGKGRHALTLANEGLDVLGVDLSEQSITAAKEIKHNNLNFEVHDMRDLIEGRKFGYIFNLFTSFGYFENEAENMKVFHVVHQMLEEEGLFIFDFLNLETTLKNLVKSEEKQIDGVDFFITKEFDGKHIIKTIDVKDGDKVLQFQERVRGYAASELKEMLEMADFEIINSFGNFHLHQFKEQTADRVIYVCKRKI